MEPTEEMLEAFGERKSLFEWARDRRSVVSHVTLTDRLKSGWELERALTVPAIKNIRQLEKVITAFGESKTLLEWATDARTQVPSRTILWRIRRGWTPEEAITEAPPEVTAPAPAGPRRLPQQFEAFGDFNTLRGWLDDPRCKVKREKLLRGLAQGLTMEQALTASAEDGRRKRGRPIVEMKIDSVAGALDLLARSAELWHAQTPGGTRSSILKGNTRYEIAPELVDSLIESGFVDLVFETPTIAEYRVSEAGKRAAK